jgi:hypothetical protein
LQCLLDQMEVFGDTQAVGSESAAFHRTSNIPEQRIFQANENSDAELRRMLKFLQ